MRQTRKFSYSKGQAIGSTEDGLTLSLVQSGYIKRYLISNDGSLSVQGIYGPGEVFPLTHVYELLLNQVIYEGPEVYYYKAMSNTVLYRLADNVLIQRVAADPTLYKDLLEVAGERLKSNIQKLENVSLSSAYKRVAHELLYYARGYGEVTPAGIKIKVPLTHSDVASLLNITRETVTISMQQLKKKGLISGERGIIVTNIDNLEEEAHA